MQNKLKKTILFIFCFSLLATNLFAVEPFEMRFEEKEQLFIVDGAVKRSPGHAIVTLEVDPDKQIVRYKTIQDLKSGAAEQPGGVFQIVSADKTMLAHSKPDWLQNLVTFFDEKSALQALQKEEVIRAIYFGGKSVSFLIIGKNFLLEVKNSVFFGNAINYMRYERA